MKLLGIAVMFLAIGSLSAQIKMTGPVGNVVFPAGRAPAGNPWGNVVTPAVPQGAAALATGHNYGFVRGFGSNGSFGSNNGFRNHRQSRSSGIYAFPVYIGGYGYAYGPDSGAPPAEQDQGNGPAPSQPPVIINQYFGNQSPSQEAPAQTESNFHYYQTPVNTDAAPADPSYYLIAFKDHSIYSAVAYYTEGDTLHYFTAGNVHNQASLSLVDRQLTEQLNRQHNVDLKLP